MSTQQHSKGFTLIELLIVVAIIAILAAIAVPNFLEAQVRSKVSRVMADQRSLATGMEAYRVDNVAYPPFPSSNPGGNDGDWDEMDRAWILIKLSTPVAYITNPLIGDPFKHPNSLSTNKSLPGWWPKSSLICMEFQSPTSEQYSTVKNKMSNNDSFPMVGNQNMKTDFPGPYKYLFLSYGPDGFIQFDNDTNAPPNSPEGYIPYEATNGTKSVGDIFRFGP